MNLSYKLVKNKVSGELVVVSELAKGHKKNTRKVAISLLLLTSIGLGHADIDLSNIEYKAGVFTGDKNNPTFIDNNNNSQKQADKLGKEHFLIHDGSTQDVTFGDVKVTHVNMPRNEYFQKITNEELVKSHAITIKNGKGETIQRLPESWSDYNLSLTDFDFDTNNGESSSIRIHDIKSVKIIAPDLSKITAEVLKKQPPVPYFNFNVITGTHGTINLNDTKNALNWDFGQIKQSSLFVADSISGSTTTINVGDDTTTDKVIMNVKFESGYRATDKDIKVEQTHKFGPTKVLAGEFKNTQLADELTRNQYTGNYAEDGNFTINTVEDLQTYQNAILFLVEKNGLTQQDYDKYFGQAIKTVQQEYTVEVNYDAGTNGGLYLDGIFGEDVGILSILKASGEKSNVMIHQNANMHVSNGHIAYLADKAGIHIHKGAEVTSKNGDIIRAASNNDIKIEQGTKLEAHNGRIINATNSSIASNSADTVIDSNMGNVALSDQSQYTNESDTTLTYQNRFNTDDIRGGSTFENKGTIVVGTSERNGTNARSATTVTGGDYHNVGAMYIGVTDFENTGRIEQGGQLAGGVAIDGSGTFTNDGNAFLGKKENGSNAKIKYKLPEKPTENDLLLKDTNTIVAAVVSENAKVTITNNQTMVVGDQFTKTQDAHIQHGAAINVETSTIDGHSSNVEITNKGTIQVGGYHSVGLRASGQIGAEKGQGKTISNNGIINVIGANSIGIVANNGAVIYNDGIINVAGDNSNLDSHMSRRNYGLKADGLAKIYTNTNINLLSDNTVGAYARAGGQIIIDGDASSLISSTAKDNVVYYWISGAHANGQTSTITFANDEIKLSSADTNSTFFRIDQGAKFSQEEQLKNTYEFDINGEGSSAMYVAGQGTTVSADKGMTFNINGENATGIYVTSGAGLVDDSVQPVKPGRVVLGKNATINISGKNTSAAVIDGAEYDVNKNATGKFIGAILDSAADFVATQFKGENSVAYRLINTGRLNHSGTIDFTGAKNATGIHIEGGTLNNTIDAKVEVNGIGVDIYKSVHNSKVENLGNITAVDGIAAIRINEGATLNVDGKAGSGLIKGEKTADAIRVHNGATLNTKDAQIAVNGSGSGIHFMNTDDNGETFTLKGSGNITVQGKDAKGILVQGKNDSVANANFDSSGSKLQINVKDAGGNGIVTNTNGYVYSGSNVTIDSEDGGSALIVKGKTTDIKQSGYLKSNSKTAVVDLTNLDTSAGQTIFLNTGKIESTHKDGIAVQATAGENINFTNQGEIIGRLDLWADEDKKISLVNSKDAKITGTLVIGDKQDGDIAKRENFVTLEGGSQAAKILAESGDTTITLNNVKETERLIAGAINNPIKDKYVFEEITANGGTKDTIALKNSYYVLNHDIAGKINGFEILDIGAKSTFELYETDFKLNESVGNKNSGISLSAADSILFINNSNDFDIKHKIYGSGTVKTDLSGKELNFDTKLNPSFVTDIGNNFKGKLWLENTLYNLDGANAVALRNAILQVGNDAKVIVANGKGDQYIGGLTFDGGRVEFQNPLSNLELSQPVGDRANSLIKVDTLDTVNAKGTISVTLDDMYNTPKGSIDVFKPIIEHDQGKSLIHIVEAQDYKGISAGDLQLEINYNGKVTGKYDQEHEIIQDIKQGQDVAAKGYYDYGLELKENSGLHVTYKLNRLDLQANQSFILVTNPDSKDTDLSAKVTGSGDLVIKGAKDISLSNNGNTYTGKTIVESGHFYLEADNVLGQTSELTIKSGTEVSVLDKASHINGTSQTVGALNIDNGSKLNLGNKGGLTITGLTDSIISGTVTGEIGSDLIFENGKATINNANTGLNSNIQLKNASTVQAYNAEALGKTGTVDIAAAAELKMGNSNPNTTVLGKNLMGTGTFTVTTGLDKGIVTDSTVELLGDNSGFTGNIVIGNVQDSERTRLVANETSLGGQSISINNRGTLDLNHSGTSEWVLNKSVSGKGNLEKSGQGILELTEDSSKYVGTTVIKDGTLVAGKDKTLNLQSTSLVIEKGARFAGTGSINGSVTNYGEFVVGTLDKQTSNDENYKFEYVVNGNFTNTGTIRLNNEYPEGVNTNKDQTTPNEYGNIGNKLIINNNYIANGGSIYLNTVLNEGFADTKTDSIYVKGSVLKQGNSTQLFVQNYGGKGAFAQVDAIEIIKVDGTSDYGAFVLGAPATIGVYEYTLHKGQKDNSWYLYSNPDYPIYDKPNQRNINPLIGGYLANAATAFEMFNVTLHDRLGNPTYGQSFLNADDSGISTWGRLATVHRKYHAASNGLAISGDFYIAQVGADLIKVAAENDGSYRFGVMAGYGSSDFTSRSRTTGSESKGKIDQALSIGLYGTWYQPEGWFVDAWLQYAHYKNEITMKNASSSKYNSNLWSASVEVGYNYKTDLFDNGDYLIIQPNAQVIFGRLSTDSYADDASRIYAKSNNQKNIQTRLGMKLFYVPHSEDNKGFRPYVEANWIHNGSNASVIFNDKFSFSSNVPKDIYELKIGIEGDLSKDWSMWGNVGYQMGKQKYKGYKATIGAKYTW